MKNIGMIALETGLSRERETGSLSVKRNTWELPGSTFLSTMLYVDKLFLF